MAGEPTITVTGNLGSDPELRTTPSGISVASFPIANTPRVKKNNEWTDGATTWFRCFVWGKDSASATNELRKGMRIFVTGRFVVDSWVDKEGKDQKTLVINVDEFGIVPRNVPEPVTVKHEKPIEDPLDDPWA